MLECVVNVSEGRAAVLGALAGGGRNLLDLHHDPHHHRAVLTLVGEDAPAGGGRPSRCWTCAPTRASIRASAWWTWCPSCRSADATMADAVAARDGSAGGRRRSWTSRLPLRTGRAATLPELRRDAWTRARPTTVPAHPTRPAGAIGRRSPPCWWPTTSGWLAATSRRPGVGRGAPSGDPRPRPGRGRPGPGEHEPDRTGRIGPAAASRQGRGAPGAEVEERSWSASCPRPCCTRCPSDVAGAGPGRRPDDRGPVGAAGGSQRPAGRRCQVTIGRRAAWARWRRRRRRSRSDMPPQMPNFSPLTSVLEALHAHDAAPAHLLGLRGRRSPLGEEEVGVDP